MRQTSRDSILKKLHDKYEPNESDQAEITYCPCSGEFFTAESLTINSALVNANRSAIHLHV